MIAGPCLILGIFMLGWTGDFPQSIPWWVPALSSPIFAASFSLVFISFLSYIG